MSLSLPRGLCPALIALLVAAAPWCLRAQTATSASEVVAVPVAAPAPAPKFESRTASLAAKGLFQGNDLTPLARQRLTDLVVEALGLQVEVALVVPTGPWQLDGSGPDERHLTPPRLAAIKRFLQERGIDGRKIFVESRINEQIAEPRLDIQIGGRPAQD